ncbi:MAG: methyl-accepting chemotaxis protein [Gemmatimonadota bacterium]|nr:methyl-accepting chemotaxis protein [Gemmatimonadota bacterium]
MDGNLTNLAEPTGVTNTDGAAGEPDRSHSIDRLTVWAAIGGVSLFALVLILGWGALAESLTAAGLWVLVGLAATLAVSSAALVVRFFVSPHIGQEISDLADVAEAMADGDLSQRVAGTAQGGQLGRLARAMGRMSDELGELAGLMGSNASETVRRSNEITGGTEHMAQAASAIAETASTLSLQSTDMADTIRLLSVDASRLNTLAANVSAGAADGIARNQRIKTLASESHELLDESARRLDALVADVQASARATDLLAAASDEIRGFVALVQKIARQSKLLALNAAMEAARAGEQGEGFTVVANEVRRLAQNATEAAERTDRLMQELIAQMETARETSVRSLTAVETVRTATQHGRQTFTQVEVAVDAADQWATTMATTAAAGNALAAEITQKLDSLTAGTTSFAHAMHDVAAASQEQSASTEEIAAAANALVAAADQVSAAARAFGTRKGPGSPGT